MGFINWLNNVAHIPVFEDVCYYNFFFWAWFWGPLLGGLVFLHDLTTGFFFSIFYVEPSLDKVIFITGCDTGFGKTLALRLGNKGFKVYATCLNQQNADALKKEVSLPAGNHMSSLRTSTRERTSQLFFSILFPLILCHVPIGFPSLTHPSPSLPPSLPKNSATRSTPSS
jgi:hypothetical protein